MLGGVNNLKFFTWLQSKFKDKSIPLNADKDLFNEYIEIYGDLYIREMAFWSAVNLIAYAVSKCEFKTFIGNKESKGPEYYLWNIEPNKNQNSSAFIHEWIAKLYRNNECLIIEHNGQLLIADSFSRKKYALYDDVFTQVTIEDFTFNRSFTQSEVLYFKLSECNMRKVISGLYESYSKMIAYSMKAYQRSKGTKAKFEYNTLPVAGTEERKYFDDLIKNKFKTFLSADSSIIPLGNGQSLNEFKTNKTYSSEGTRDIRAMIDDIFDFTAKGFGIPPALLKGDVQGTKDVVDNLLTFCIDGLTDMFAEEINRKRSGQKAFLEGTYLKIDTGTIKHIDLLSVSTAIDKLISSGAFSVNGVLKLLGEQPIDEPWADKHFITKNYELLEEALKAVEENNNE